VKDFELGTYGGQWNQNALEARWTWFFDEVGALLNVDLSEVRDKHQPQLV
jgi:hypothetical protein